MSQNVAQKCLRKLEELKKKIQNIMQIRQDANQFNKYRINYQITQPRNLVGGTLQQHQLESLEWMINLAAQESNGILADDMGLGKTIQAISYLAYLKQENGIRGRHMIICPKSVCNNWMREISKWFPSSRAVLLQNTQEERQRCLKQVIRPLNFDILITTFEGAKNCLLKLQNIKWQTLIIDQAHKIKNFQSQNFQAIYQYQATFKLLLSGTPLSNSLKQLWVLLFFIMPDLFNDSSLFQEIQQSVSSFEGTQDQKLEFRMKIAKYFHAIINPFFKRRAKKDLQLGLPPKIQKTLYVPLSEMQLKMYKNFIRYGNVYGEDQKPNRHIMNARKICLHPYLFEGMWPQDQQQFGQHAIQNCGKLKVLDKLLKKLLNQGHKILLFSQFTLFLDFLEQYCQYRKFRFCRLDGSTPLQERDQYMHKFNNTDQYQIFMLSTKAGGLGINLIGADRVIIYDIDWNPQNDVQAMDRAYRIGQTKTVHVYKMITQFTIQQRISEFQKYKLIWDELVIQKGAFMTKKEKHKDDPFKNISLQTLNNIGKGEIFRLKVNQNDQTIEEIQKMGYQKDKKVKQEIKKKLQQNLETQNLDKFNPFSETQQSIPPPTEDQIIFKRRNYEMYKRQRSKFQRHFMIPPFKFYIKAQKIRQLQFQICMQLKREENDQNKKLLDHLQSQLVGVYQQQKFHKWTEQEFDTFVKAHQVHYKADYKSIAEFIKTKSEDEVEEYSKVFFEKAPNNERLQDVLQDVKFCQTKLKIKQKSSSNQQSKESTNEIKKVSKVQKTRSQIEEQKRLRQQARINKEQEKKTLQAEKKAKKEQRQKQIEQRKEQKRIRAQKWQQVLQERKEKKERELQQKQERKKQAIQKRIARLEQIALQKKENQQNKFKLESQKILKKAGVQNVEKRRNPSVSSKSTEKRFIDSNGKNQRSDSATKGLKSNPPSIANPKKKSTVQIQLI